jgi:hypothetical protein
MSFRHMTLRVTPPCPARPLQRIRLTFRDRTGLCPGAWHASCPAAGRERTIAGVGSHLRHDRRTIGWQAGPCSGGRQDEPDRASRKRSCQSGVDCGYQVVVPFGYASHADRVRADRQAAAVDPPWDARRRFHAVRRADEGARGSDRRAAWPRQSRSVSQINFRVLVPAPQHDLPRVPRLLTTRLIHRNIL